MKLRQVLISGWVALALMLIFSTVAGAEVVGRLTELEGRVDLLKGGKLPAVALKVNDTVEPGDVIRTKSLSKAQITFIDNSLLTISQESRLAIEEFKFDPSQEKRHAVLQIFQGLALAVVNKILKAEEPDFVIKTQTAIMGVRGTEIGMRNEPNSSTILNFQGRTQVGNILPQVSRLFLKAFKVAYDWRPTGDSPRRGSFWKICRGPQWAQSAPDHALWYHSPRPDAVHASAHHLYPFGPTPHPGNPGDPDGIKPPGRPPSAGEPEHRKQPDYHLGPAQGGASGPGPPADPDAGPGADPAVVPGLQHHQPPWLRLNRMVTWERGV